MPKKSDDLLNEIIQRRRARQIEQQTDPLARVLDDLNVMDTLAAISSRASLCYGPKVIRSAAPSLGVVIWQRPPGYHGYKTLILAGVWVSLRSDRPILAVGKKHLAFSAPFYDADAYHKLIRKSYDLYYADNNKPPAQPSYTVAYDAEQRLELRETIGREVWKCLG